MMARIDPLIVYMMFLMVISAGFTGIGFVGFSMIVNLLAVVCGGLVIIDPVTRAQGERPGPVYIIDMTATCRP